MSRRNILILAAAIFFAAVFPLLGVAAALIAVGYGIAQPPLNTLNATPRNVTPTTKKDL